MPIPRPSELTDEQTRTPETTTGTTTRAGAAPAPRRELRAHSRRRRWSWIAAPGVVAVSASVLAGAALTSGPAPQAEAAVPDRLLQAAQLQRQTTTSAAWFEHREVRAASDARIEAERLAAEAAAAAEAARLAEEARRLAAEEATRSAQRDPRSLARAMAAERGWGEEQFSCLDSLWTKESGWDYAADNPTSSAYGIPQALPGSKMASAGADWETNPATQIAWGLGYIDSRYGTPCSAWSHSRASNWY
ncbi:lytic transglycosylase domain-containing protein [Kineococcus vitellinus]|uniref:aggregation-promoting factor C-terminal-like domain-containing protein n=1 Tax=Kineococcus vitellinus TaxID=2696565 RepID=UPI00196B3D6C|nr:lytic transglycosylase domain-containing protein [Kineococcus vitellinus]